MALTGFLKFLLIALAINFFTSSAARNLNRKPTSNANYQEFIRKSCSATTYPRLCLGSLSSQASSIQTSPKLLAHAALNVTLSAAKSSSIRMARLSQSHGLSPREVQAMHDCVEELIDAVDELGKSIGEMGQIGGSNFGLTINDIQTWVSAALTDESTCADGFDGKNMNESVKTAVRGQIVKISQLTSNALALVNSYASLQG
ncbi:putative DC1.2-like [Tripterygium wilfordii]|uniref:Putative DC1.2-like n=1 Tax=Tripterygium wilfordii TaxID=458696 RepID=A0A7J7CA89_TRIWF|nr:21 kDa protein-like [Tripterygium wilfordii]KAF5731081.1 putative DC1.2-like [Tripterygium wilfordii]